jgi:hypothetical protein
MTKNKKFKKDLNNLKWWDNANKKTEELSRWISLYEAVNIIADKAEDLGKDFSKIQINPLKVREYMDSTVDIYHKKLLNQLYGINVVYTENQEDFDDIL